MYKNRHKPTIFLVAICSLLIALPPSVSAQNIIKTRPQPDMILRFGIGGQQIWRGGPIGGNITFNAEDPINKHLSWTANVVIMMNPLDIALPPDTRGSYHTRFVLQPDFRYYPTEVLRRLYIGSGLGIVAGYGKTIGAYPNGKSQVNIFGEAITDLKIGWQAPLLDRFVWNAFVSTALLLPLNGDKAIPMLRAGIQIGMNKRG
jgi:hypothetical protein